MKCSQCGVCCKLFVINLSEEEYKSGKYKTQFEEFGITSDFTEAEYSGANIITQKDDGSCIYQEPVVLEYAQEYTRFKKWIVDFVHWLETKGIFPTYQKDNKCSIHETRPEVCRKFFCTDPSFKSMICKIDEYKNK